MWASLKERWGTLTSTEKVAVANLVFGGVSLCVAGIALLILKWTLDETRKSADATARTMELSHRAELVESWVFGKPPDGLVANTLATFTISIENAGQLPATNVTPIMNHDIIPKGAMPSFPLPGVEIRPMVIPAGKSWPLEIDVPGEDLSNEPGNNQLAMIDDERNQLLLYGVVLYEDGFRRRCLSFCKRFAPPIQPGGARRCEEVPDCDRYKEWTDGGAVFKFPADFEGTPSPIHGHQQFRVRTPQPPLQITITPRSPTAVRHTPTSTFQN